jgi:hypothetical protein
MDENVICFCDKAHMKICLIVDPLVSLADSERQRVSILCERMQYFLQVSANDVITPSGVSLLDMDCDAIAIIHFHPEAEVVTYTVAATARVLILLVSEEDASNVQVVGSTNVEHLKLKGTGPVEVAEAIVGKLRGEKVDMAQAA